MTKKRIWEKRWKEKSKDAVKSTSLDFFAKNAFEVLDRNISRNDEKILEVGSGTGRFCIALAQKYPDKKITGIDYTKESVDLSNKGAELRHLKNVRFYKKDLFHLPYKSNSFDVVFENGVIEHFINYNDAIKEMTRVAKKGGKVIINVNNWFCFPKTVEKKILGKSYPFGYEKSFRNREVIGALADAGLKKIEVYAYNPFNYIVRFLFFNIMIKNIVSYFVKIIEILLDFITFGYFSRKFGYMLFGKGEKR